jgi:hypothetical protein
MYGKFIIFLKLKLTIRVFIISKDEDCALKIQEAASHIYFPFNLFYQIIFCLELMGLGFSVAHHATDMLQFEIEVGNVFVLVTMCDWFRDVVYNFLKYKLYFIKTKIHVFYVGFLKTFTSKPNTP